MLTHQSLNRDTVALERSHKEMSMVIEQEKGENQVDFKIEIHDRVKRHKVQLQILVDAIQDIKDKMDYMFERREMTPLKEDGSGEDFQEDPSRGKENQKTPPEVKQGSKDSNVYKSNGE